MQLVLNMKIFLSLTCFYTYILIISGNDLGKNKCKDQPHIPPQENFIKEVNIPTDQHKFNLQLTWLGKDNRKIIIAVSDIMDSNIFLIDLSFSLNLTKINNRLINDNGDNIDLTLIKHSFNNSIVYFLSNFVKSTLYASFDEGTSFTRIILPFHISSISFHPTMEQHMLAVDDIDHTLYYSSNYGFNWTRINQNVIRAKWGLDAMKPNQIFVIVNRRNTEYFLGLLSLMKVVDNVLQRSDDFGNSWKDVQKYVYSFGIEGQFVYTSVYVDPNLSTNRRVLMVSTNGGDNWNQVKLPEISHDLFYSILDMSEGQIFLHVDDSGDTGKGVLYTSDATGILFSKSLLNHLYTNSEQITDFYKVESMRGVFITSILANDDSVQTMITYNRGADWQFIDKPEGVECEDFSNDINKCHLHIHNLYSIQRGVKSLPPKSVASASGIILAHGNVAESLQNTEPNVYVSTDGGLTWKLSLKGPHHYVIGDQGGFFAAVHAFVITINSIKLSTDEGSCWTEYNFTEPGDFVFKNLLIEPSSKDFIVAVWGYSNKTNQWMTFIVNATKVITKQCGVDDYETWSPKNHQGQCLLGVKETFQKIKTDSQCYNGIAKQLKKEKSTDCDSALIPLLCVHG